GPALSGAASGPCTGGVTAHLVIDEGTIRRQGPGNIVAVCYRQIRTERALRRRGICFRTADENAVADAYRRMSVAEFDLINGRQDWANWRTIPRSLSGHVADRPLTVLDLGCGTGSSTAVLAFYCPQGSRIIGYEFTAALVDIARQRDYRQQSGAAVAVEFVCQSVTEELRQPGGEALPDRSVDVINASGIVGHHLNSTSAAPLVAEMQRLLVADGIAMLDVGPTLDAKELPRLMAGAGFRCLGRRRSCFIDPGGQMIFARARG
ncbi:MAG: class I SAM-dependent methyltransferase, partial [Gemmataceae bacterium]